MKTFFLAFLLSLGIGGSMFLLSGCDLLFPPIKVQFADTTVTAPNGSIILYGTVWQTPLDSATLARLRSEGYTGGTDKASVVGAEVIASMGDTKLTTTTDRLGRYVFVLKNSGTYSLITKHYATIPNEPLSFDIKASTQKDITLRPAREFSFPLAIGNKWVYDYRGTGVGTTSWEVIRQEPVNEGVKFFVQITSQGIYNSQPYYSLDTFNIVKSNIQALSTRQNACK